MGSDMALFVLDTDILSLLQIGNPAVLARVAACDPSELATTVVTVQEQIAGRQVRLSHAKTPADEVNALEGLIRSVRFLASMQILNATESSITRTTGLLKLRLKVKKNDLRIAAIVLE